MNLILPSAHKQIKIDFQNSKNQKDEKHIITNKKKSRKRRKGRTLHKTEARNSLTKNKKVKTTKVFPENSSMEEQLLMIIKITNIEKGRKTS